MHKIKQGKTAHFFIHNIIEDAQPFIKVFESTPKVKDSNQVSKTTNLKEIERMASKLGSLFDFVHSLFSIFNP